MFTGNAAPNYCQFLREKGIKREDVYHQAFYEDGMQEKVALNHVMWSVDAGEALGQQEGPGRQCKLTKAQVKKVTF